MPGKVADFLRTAEVESGERAALDRGTTVRRGKGYTLRVTAPALIHRQLLAHSRPLADATAHPAQHKARREYENRVNVLEADPLH